MLLKVPQKFRISEVEVIHGAGLRNAIQSLVVDQARVDVSTSLEESDDLCQL